jgi:hypothetical protein
MHIAFLKHTLLVATGCDVRDRILNPITHTRGKYEDNKKYKYYIYTVT